MAVFLFAPPLCRPLLGQVPMWYNDKAMFREKFGIFAWFGYISSFKDRAGMIREAGFDSTSIWFGPEFSQFDGDYRKNAEIAAMAGLQVDSAHLPYYGSSLLWQRSREAGDFAANIASAIRNAGDLGISCVVLHPHDVGIHPSSYGTALAAHLRLAEAACAAGVKLAIENLDKPGVTARLINDINSEDVGLCFDTGHSNLTGEWEILLAQNKGRMFSLHAHDNDGNEDAHLLPFEGTVDWAATTSAIEAAGYSGHFMLESMKPYPDNSPMPESAQIYLARALESAKRAVQPSAAFLTEDS